MQLAAQDACATISGHLLNGGRKLRLPSFSVGPGAGSGKGAERYLAGATCPLPVEAVFCPSSRLLPGLFAWCWPSVVPVATNSPAAPSGP